MRECATFWWALRSARGWDRPSPPSERALTITGAVSDCHSLHDDGGWCPACAPEPTPEREPFQPLSIPPFMARSLTSLASHRFFGAVVEFQGGSNQVRAPPRAQACLRQLPADHPRGPAMLKPPRTGVPMVRITEFLVQGCRRRLLHHPALLETSTHRRDPLGRLSADLTTVVCPGSNPAVEDHHLQRRSHRQRPQSKVCCRCARSLSLAHFCPCPAQMHAIPLSAEPHALEPFLFPPRRSAHAHTTPCCGDRRRPLPA